MMKYNQRYFSSLKFTINDNAHLIYYYFLI